MLTVEWLMLVGGGLLLAGILASKLSAWLGVPALIIFLAIGMLAGSDGLGGIEFSDARLAQAVGVTALAFILFSGGLDTPVSRIKPVLKAGLALSTIGVAITAVTLGVFAAWLLQVPLLTGLLLGAVASSTDAAAVFSILRSRATRLKGQLEPLLELESGSNDPTAVILTLGLISLITDPGSSAMALLGAFVVQVAAGALAGYLAGRVGVFLINKTGLRHDGLYSVLTIALVAVTYGATTLLGGNGFLAVYLAGIVMGNRDFLHKKSLLRFHDGLAWLMQITMFLTLGLLVFPSQLPAIAGVGMAIAVFLVVVARPLAVFIALSLSRLAPKEKVLVSWVGLRGAAPIVLATFPLVAGIPAAGMIFNVVFFVVLISVLIQGTTIPLAARILGLDETEPVKSLPLSEHAMEHLTEVKIAPGSTVAGQRIVDLALPEQVLVVFIAREGGHIIPTGATELQVGDSLLLATNQEESPAQLAALFA